MSTKATLESSARRGYRRNRLTVLDVVLLIVLTVWLLCIAVPFYNAVVISLPQCQAMN